MIFSQTKLPKNLTKPVSTCYNMAILNAQLEKKQLLCKKMRRSRLSLGVMGDRTFSGLREFDGYLHFWSCATPKIF